MVSQRRHGLLGGIEHIDWMGQLSKGHCLVHSYTHPAGENVHGLASGKSRAYLSFLFILV